MITPDLPLQAALIAALKAHPGLTAIVGARVFDKVPTGSEPEHPYVSLGPDQTVPDQNPCGDQFECWAQIDCWSRKPGRVQAKAMTAAVADVLSTSLAIEGFRVVVQTVETLQHRPQPDGLTTLGKVDVYWSVVPAAA